MIATLLFSLTACVSQSPAPETLVLTSAHVLDPSGERWIDGASVVIENGEIAAIAPARAELGDARVLDLAGLYLVPGLIDLHTHLVLHPYDEASWESQVLKESLELRTIRGVVAARATLEAGFTAVRDLGTEGAGFADVALRDAIASGMIPGPRVFASTRAIVASGCYGPAGFDPRWSVPKGAQEADGVDGVRKAVREQVAAGADWIKVYADYRRAPGEKATPTFSQAELDALVDEAKSAGRKVAAHASTDEGVRRAVQAGVATIEHGYGASEDTLRMMLERGVVLCPTLAASDAVARYAGWNGAEPAPTSVRESRELVKRATKLRVTIACGSDAGVFAHGDNVRELELLAQCGLSPSAVLRAATSTAAKTLGINSGAITEHGAADLIAVRADPLRDVAALREPVLVLQRGRVALDRR